MFLPINLEIMVSIYLYLKALHIIFLVTWFAGMFYTVRLFIYNTEAGDKAEPERTILREQFRIMLRRLWFGITWPSAILTLILGPWLWFLMASFPTWLEVKLVLVLGLYLYHLSLHLIYRQEMKGVFKFSSQSLRLWNEVATLFLFGIVFIAVLKDGINWVRSIIGFLLLVILLMIAIKIYKRVRSAKRGSK
jgi:protoporphyrinogen IX oxidase